MLDPTGDQGHMALGKMTETSNEHFMLYFTEGGNLWYEGVKGRRAGVIC